MRHISNLFDPRQHATFLIYVKALWQNHCMPKTLPVVDITAPACCAPLAAGPMSDDDALRVALRLKALADPARVKIMSLLFCSPAGEQNTGELAGVLGLTESTVSHHLGQLRNAGLVESRPPRHERLPPSPSGCDGRPLRGARPELLQLISCHGDRHACSVARSDPLVNSDRLAR